MQIRGPKSDLRSSRVPGALRGSILDGFLIILGPILGLFSGGFWTYLTDHTHVFKTFAATFGEVFWRDYFVAFLTLVCILLGVVLFVLGEDFVCVFPCLQQSFIAASNCSCPLSVVDVVKAAPQARPKTT